MRSEWGAKSDQVPEIDLEKLKKIWEFFAWADKYRVYSDHLISSAFNRTEECVGKLSPRELVLAVWLTYIFDFRMPAELVWRNMFPIMAWLSHGYSTNFKDEDLGKLLEGVRGGRKGKEGKDEGRYILPKSDGNSPCGEVTFKHVYGKSQYLEDKVRETLEILKEEDFDKNFVKFLFCFMREPQTDNPEHSRVKDDWIRRVAYALQVLTYGSKKRSLDERKRLLTSHDDFLQEYMESREKFERGEIGNKRLWSALKDLLKNEMVKKKVIEEADRIKIPDNLISKWKDPGEALDQLELPGDVWNTKFLMRIEGIPGKLPLKISTNTPENSRKIVRRLYEKYKDELNKDRPEGDKLYPEQFDVTFDFVPKMCSKDLCTLCPLGCGAKHLCVGDLIMESGGEKICPVLLFSFGYLMKCTKERAESCPVRKGEFRMTCPDGVRLLQSISRRFRGESDDEPLPDKAVESEDERICLELLVPSTDEGT